MSRSSPGAALALAPSSDDTGRLNLAEVALGTAVEVTAVRGDRGFRRRLMELGLVPGTRVTLEKVAPLGDPLELRLRGCSLSIRAAEARRVWVAACDQGE
jgi:Fe2+ transport system protein FeoA